MVASSSDPFNLFKYREEFQRGGALQDVTINSNDSAMMLYPHNPLLVKEETEAAKVSYYMSFKELTVLSGPIPTTKVYAFGASGQEAFRLCHNGRRASRSI